MSSRIWAVSIPDRENIIKAAIEGKELAYSRYSNFRVGAALLAVNGTIIKGCNVENASHGGTICAERTAFVKAVSEGIKSFMALAVVTDIKAPISPCGICRQFIREFCAADMPIFLVPADYPQPPKAGEVDDGSGGVVETSIEELLPRSFGPEDLELPRG